MKNMQYREQYCRQKIEDQQANNFFLTPPTNKIEKEKKVPFPAVVEITIKWLYISKVSSISTKQIYEDQPFRNRKLKRRAKHLIAYPLHRFSQLPSPIYIYTHTSYP